MGFRFVDLEKQLIFTDPDKDGYTYDDEDAMLDENQVKLDSILTNDGYDIGHVFSTSGGGKASLGSICNPDSKGRGVTGLTTPSSKLFAIDYVAHEMGHQFGANHTFNGINFKNGNPGACSNDVLDPNGSVITLGTRHPATAFEPGSGSTIMSYGGICGTEDFVEEVDDFFHSISLAEIFTHLETIDACTQTIVTGNQPPTINAGANYIIPKETPFALTASGEDPDGNTLLYSWDEVYMDKWRAGQWLPASGPPNNDTDGKPRPLFRAFRPSINQVRLFPNLTSLLKQEIGFPESLLTLKSSADGKGILTFRAVARDARGGFGFDDVNIEVIGKTGGKIVGPFQVTQPRLGTSWKQGTRQQVKWNVANTNIAPVSCTNVKITLSLNGGRTFDVVLAESTANDGVEFITIPAHVAITNRARIKIEAINNIFFNLSANDFHIIAGI